VVSASAATFETRRFAALLRMKSSGCGPFCVSALTFPSS
jgi:hypothetical protein